MTPPEGFKAILRPSPSLELLGPVYMQGQAPALSMGMYAATKHCNSRGIMHGGIIAFLADTAIGYAVALGTTPPTPAVTVNLSVDYAGMVNVGDWLEARVDVQKQGKHVVFANCFLWVGDKRIARASAVFSVLQAHGGPPLG